MRELSQALRLNTNTAHKVVAELVRDGLLQVTRGIGTVVTEAPRAPDAVRQRLLDEDLERLVVEARRLGLTQAELLAGLQSKWSTLFGPTLAASQSIDALQCAAHARGHHRHHKHDDHESDREATDNETHAPAGCAGAGLTHAAFGSLR